jgi:hypothetical protein
MSSPRAAISVASRIECACDLKLMSTNVYYTEHQAMSGHAPIEIFKTLSLLELGVKWERG